MFSSRSMLAGRRVAVVGAGPAGLYAVGHLLTATDESRDVVSAVDVIDRDYAPFGLVRYGVAPDHQDDKKVIDVLDQCFQDARVRFFGHCLVGTMPGAVCSVARLLGIYDAVLLSTGAFRDRPWPDAGPKDHVDGTPWARVFAERAVGLVPASQFVAWYNQWESGRMVGELASPPPPPPAFDGRQAVVVGAGNVALDVCRVLLKAPSDLAVTDMSTTAVQFLRENRAREVHLVARRGLLDAAYTNRVLRDLLSLVSESSSPDQAPAVVVHCGADDADLLLGDGSLNLSTDRALSRIQSRQLKLWRQLVKKNAVRVATTSATTAAGQADGGGGTLHFWFWRRPELDLDALRSLKLCSTGDTTNAPAADPSCSLTDVGLVVPCVGFEAEPGLDGVTLKNGMASSDGHGRVLDDAGQCVPGLYVTGWLKRGPTGIIGSNRDDALDTVAAMVRDFSGRSVATGGQSQDFAQLLDEMDHRFVDYSHWTRLNQSELEHGQAQGKIRVKTSMSSVF